jgi:hypothetical protein
MSASQPVGFVPIPAQRRLLDFVDANPNLSRQLGDVMSKCGRPLPASDARPQPDQREGGSSKRWPCHPAQHIRTLRSALR